MAFFCGGIFWGCVFMLLGLSIILKAVFHVNLPIFRIIIAGIFIFMGIRMLMGPSWSCRMPGMPTTMFAENRINAGSAQGHQEVLFGRALIDATQGTAPLSANTVFGSTLITISKTVPTEIRVESAFGRAGLPDGSAITFGSLTWLNTAAKSAPAGSVKRIDVHVVFGECTIVER